MTKRSAGTSQPSRSTEVIAGTNQPKRSTDGIVGAAQSSRSAEGAVDRRRFVGVVGAAAEAVAELLGGYQLRGAEPYPIGQMLPALAERHRALQEAVDAYAGPLTVDAAGRRDPLGEELAGLMSWLQQLRVLYHGLDDIPDSLRVNAGRIIPIAHLAARRVRDRARRETR